MTSDLIQKLRALITPNRRGVVMRICKECKYFMKERCSHPTSMSAGDVDVVTGVTQPAEMEWCAVVRMHSAPDNQCRRQGRYWEAKDGSN